MELSQFESYLNIDSSRYNNIDKASLDYFMERYMMTVPFENINVQNQVPISVNINDLLDKVINQHRGGFCYEMNHLFGTYLEKKVLLSIELLEQFILRWRCCFRRLTYVFIHNFK